MRTSTGWDTIWIGRITATLGAALCLFSLANQADALEVSLCPPAEVERNPSSNTSNIAPCGESVWISGTIEEGSFEVFKAFLQKNAQKIFNGKRTIRAVSFGNVSGNDFGEAARIGRLIRDLRLITVIPLRFPTARIYGSKLRVKEGEQVSCLDACFLAWIGGYPAVGDSDVVISQQSIAEGRAATELVEEVNQYLRYIGAKDEFIRIWNSTSEGEDYRLSETQAHVFFGEQKKAIELEHLISTLCLHAALNHCSDEKYRQQVLAEISENLGVNLRVDGHN